MRFYRCGAESARGSRRSVDGRRRAEKSATLAAIRAALKRSEEDTDAVVRVAEKSGAWYCITRRAAAGIGRVVAARWLERQA